MLSQYFLIKEKYPNCLLFFRMGDFYELFFNDAIQGAKALDIQLTQRGKHNNKNIDMCGVPVRTAETYLARLIKHGFKVAICEQVETAQSAKQRGDIVRREVVRLVTPGTLSEDGLLNPSQHNYLLSIARQRGTIAIAFAEISTGNIYLKILNHKEGWNALQTELARLTPAEILVPDHLIPHSPLNKEKNQNQNQNQNQLCLPTDIRNAWREAITEIPARDDSEIVNVLNEMTEKMAVRMTGQTAKENTEESTEESTEAAKEWRQLANAASAWHIAERAALAELLSYIAHTQVSKLPRLTPPRRHATTQTLEMDAATRSSLELARHHDRSRNGSRDGSRGGSLLATIDRTASGAGARLLASWLATPLAEPGAINERLDGVETITRDGKLRGRLAETLKKLPEMERALARLSLGRGGPRDLSALLGGLEGCATLALILEEAEITESTNSTESTESTELEASENRASENRASENHDSENRVSENRASENRASENHDSENRVSENRVSENHDSENRASERQLPTILASAADQLAAPERAAPNLARELRRALVELPPLTTQAGGFIRATYNPQLDALRNAENETRRKIATLQEQYARSSGIPSLRIRHNRVLGYYIEVSPTLAAKMPTGHDSPFRHRQTLANAVRYSSDELREMEDHLASASIRAIALEEEIFNHLASDTLSSATANAIATAAQAAARVDVLSSLAACALEREWVRPKFTDSPIFHLKGGRHPVVEAALAAQGNDFVANDCKLGGNAPYLQLLTGPNMAGKSTYLRQNALLLILAQLGSFVPAISLTLGVADRLFSRIGAADDLARGHSTFMVEMLEVAQILRSASTNAFVILDELGRGTSTHDGLAIAWAASEHLHNTNKCRTLFATHYHELAPLYQQLPAAQTLHMRVREWSGEIVFLHEVAEGASGASYGLHVAKLAGIPEPILIRAAELLANLEATNKTTTTLPPRKTASSVPPTPATPHPLLKAMEAMNPDQLTPREALETLYQLKTLLNTKK
ncbi:MAG: DNA mismatch repair protein MutS [Alphaproteobacteria bacterium]